MYTVLSGAKVNVGDFLITDRAKALLRHVRPEHDLFELPHWEPLDDHLDRINGGDAVIILGGPGYQPGFYPKVYKLTRRFEDIKVPVIPMGLGWKGFPGDFATLARYRFSERSLEILRTMASQFPYLGCRDYLTLEALRRNGLKAGLMTGCPVWYHIPSLQKEMTFPSKIRKLVFTPPHRPVYKKQGLSMLTMLATLFSNATRYCVFHRGISTNDAFRSTAHERMNPAIRDKAMELGYSIVDAASDLSKIEFYQECDLHVGYRLHAHLAFLSRRYPSVLLHEDGRGRGVSHALNLMGIDAFRRNTLSSLLPGSFRHRFDRSGSTLSENPEAKETLRMFLTQELENGFARYKGLPSVINAHFIAMKKFLDALP